MVVGIAKVAGLYGFGRGIRAQLSLTMTAAPQRTYPYMVDLLRQFEGTAHPARIR
jgi:hypothetical protein